MKKIITFFLLLLFICFYSAIHKSLQDTRDTRETSDLKLTDSVYNVTPASSTKEEVESTPNGKYNLNLLLLSDPLVNAYIKDYFKLLDDCEKGLISDRTVHTTAEDLYILSQCEQGNYAGTFFPQSYLNVTLPGRIDHLRGSLAYGSQTDSKGKFTLTDYNVTQFKELQEGTEMFPIAFHGYSGQWQIDPKYYQNNGGTSLPAKGYNWHGSDSSRKSNNFYMPDMLAWIDMNYETFFKEHNDLVGDLTLTSFDKFLMLEQAEASPNLVAPEMFGDYKASSFSKEKRQALVDDIENVVTGGNIKTWVLEGYQKGLTENQPNEIATIILLSNGWKISQSLINASSLQLNEITFNKWYNIIFPGETPNMKSFLNSHVVTTQKALGMESSNIGYYYKEDGDMVHYFPFEIARNLFKYSVSGPYSYGAMLKQMGLAVDPTNPDTYLTKLSSGGQYTPNSLGALPSALTVPVISAYTKNYTLKKHDAQSLAYFYSASTVGLSSEAGNNPASWSKINSYGEKDGMPLFAQGIYYNNGVSLDSKYLDMQLAGCSVFAMTSAIYGVGMGVDSSIMPTKLKEAIKYGNVPDAVTPQGLDAYMSEKFGWSKGNSVMGNITIMFNSLGVPSTNLAWTKTRETDINALSVQLKNNYPIVYCILPSVTDMYVLTDYKTKTVQSLCKKSLTQNGHYIVAYSSNMYTGADGIKFEGVSIIDSSNYGNGGVWKDYGSNDIIIKISDLYDIGNHNVCGSVITTPLLMGKSNTKDTTVISKTESPTEQIATGKFPLDAINVLLEVSKNSNESGIINLAGQDLGKLYLSVTEAKISSDSKELWFRVDNSNTYFKLTSDSAKFKSITNNKYNLLSDILTSDGTFTIAKYSGALGGGSVIPMFVETD